MEPIDENLQTAYFKRGGIVHRLPTAFCAASTATLSDQDRQAIADHAAALEQRRYDKINKIKAYNEKTAKPEQ